MYFQDEYCRRCGTRLNNNFTYCPMCNYDNYTDIENQRNRWRNELYLDRIAEASKAGFNSVEEHQLWKEKIDLILEQKIKRTRLYEKLFYLVTLPFISLTIPLLIIPNWWLIFKLLFSIIIYLAIRMVYNDILDVFDNRIKNLKHRYKEISLNSILLKDNGQLKETIIKTAAKNTNNSTTGFIVGSGKESITPTPNKTNNTSKSNYSNNNKKKSIQNFGAIVNKQGNFFTIEFNPSLNSNSLEKLKVFINNNLPKDNSKKTTINGQGRNIRTLNAKEVSLISDYLSTIGIDTKQL